MKPLTPPDGRQVFDLAIRPRPDDIDENGHVNNVVYLRWAQDLATAHWRSRAPEDAQDRWAWVVLRHEVDYRRALKLDETAQARTWLDETPRGAQFDRFVRIDAPDGALCAQAKTTWCLLDRDTGRPSRVPTWMTETFT